MILQQFKSVVGANRKIVDEAQNFW